MGSDGKSVALADIVKLVTVMVQLSGQWYLLIFKATRLERDGEKHGGPRPRPGTKRGEPPHQNPGVGDRDPCTDK